MSMVTKSTKSRTYRIWMAGNYANAEEICRKYCERGMCVSITPMNYIYTGGEESGFCVTFINYPRFPSSIGQMFLKAKKLGDILMKALHQHSYSLEGPRVTHFYSTRSEDET